ncbi:IQ and ubiquitin-like domain-containing protein isoform X1 [Nasonia vitripennis]|uniref:IQ motif and ubiquitin-like domain-containing protein n=1 Tax=Nasonia vitripennis TaxID=7425 RepID=A0A7M7H650_NASVI|nr:IQ and ubiquitin-like domain-containing protein isoform X1 [Nasonia vitripennis]
MKIQKQCIVLHQISDKKARSRAILFIRYNQIKTHLSPEVGQRDSILFLSITAKVFSRRLTKDFFSFIKCHHISVYGTDTFTLQSLQGEINGYKMLVTVERSLMRKPRLGGWRDPATGLEYLNADSQTGPAPKRLPLERTCSRKVQTILSEDKQCQSNCDSATQMWRRDCYIPSVSDKYVSVGSYETYEEMRLRLDFDGKARKIQRCYRAYRILKLVRNCAKAYREMREECERLREEKVQNRRELEASDCLALNHPRTLTDLDALLHHIDTVDLPKLDDQSCSPRSRNLRLLEVRRRAYLAAELRRNRGSDRAKFLAFHCKPKRWLDRRGRSVEMLGLRNQAARELWEMYRMLDRDAGEERMEVLLQARSAIENHVCKDASSFRDLLDQEIIMTAKNVMHDKLDYLRKRIVGAFLQFVKTSHNCTCKSVDGIEPIEIHDYEFRLPMEKDRMFCTSCRKLLPQGKFPVTVRRQQINKCKACVRLRTNVRSSVDLKPFIHLLSEIRESEPVVDPIIDVLSPSDLRHLVQDIWHGRSVLSGESETRKLRLPRYRVEEPWSPWNCLLLTEDEAEVHRRLGEKMVYSKPLQKIVEAAHCTARMKFGLWTVEKKVIVSNIES